MFKYDKNKCSELLGKINFQKIITRHGLAHSIIHILCLPFLLACKNLTLTTNFIWLTFIIIISFQAAIGFLATNGWYEGLLNTILSIE
jgi:hypothetical protein